jgi:hypothetical protein
MSIFDKLLRLTLFESLTETTLWADTVFRGLEQDVSGEQGMDLEISGTTTQSPDEPFRH